jgi:hypothetical protein
MGYKRRGGMGRGWQRERRKDGGGRVEKKRGGMRELKKREKSSELWAGRHECSLPHRGVHEIKRMYLASRTHGLFIT